MLKCDALGGKQACILTTANSIVAYEGALTAIIDQRFNDFIIGDWNQHRNAQPSTLISGLLFINFIRFLVVIAMLQVQKLSDALDLIVKADIVAASQ